MNRAEQSYPEVIRPDRTWDITDATKLNTYQECPRKYFYNYVLGWRSDSPNIHLEWGGGIHEGMDVLLRGKRAGIPFSDERLREAAYAAFLEKYSRSFDPAFDEGNGNKTALGARMLLNAYCDYYERDPEVLKVLYVEIPGAVQVTEDHLLHFRIDTIVETPWGISSLEHKTTGMNSDTWANQWALSLQVGAYTHALHTNWPEDDLYGVLVNGLIIKKRDCDFRRVPVQRFGNMMSAWLSQVHRLLYAMDHEFEVLADSTPDDPCLEAFPMNTQSCTKYGTCPYHAYCTAWANPLTRCEEPPIGTKVEHWDPSEVEGQPEMVVTGTGEWKTVEKETSSEPAESE